MIFTAELANELWQNKILFKVKSPPPGRRRYGWMPIGENVRLRETVRIEAFSGLYRGPYKASVGGGRYSGLCSIGAFSYSYSPLPEPVRVGRYSSISNGLVFLDSHHPMDLVTTSIITFRPNNPLVSDFISKQQARGYGWERHNGKAYPTIGNDVWIARDVTLAMGISIGDGAVIGAGAVVTKDVPPYAVVVGNPARVVKYRQPPEIASELLRLRWWEYDPKRLLEIGFDRPANFCIGLEHDIASGTIERFSPKVIEFE